MGRTRSTWSLREEEYLADKHKVDKDSFEARAQQEQQEQQEQQRSAVEELQSPELRRLLEVAVVEDAQERWCGHGAVPVRAAHVPSGTSLPRRSNNTRRRSRRLRYIENLLVRVELLDKRRVRNWVESKAVPQERVKEEWVEARRGIPQRSSPRGTTAACSSARRGKLRRREGGCA